jgi:hypothetical protein
MARQGNTDGWHRLPDDRIVVGVVVPGTLAGRSVSLRIVLVAADRKAAAGRVKSLGFHGVRLTDNWNEPTTEEITAALGSPDGLVWRPWLAEGPWRTGQPDGS